MPVRWEWVAVLWWVVAGCDCASSHSIEDAGPTDAELVDATHDQGCGAAECEDAALCVSEGSACGPADECCSGACVGDICTRPCGEVDAACGAHTDCCSGHCAGSDGERCVGTGLCTCAPPPPCRGTGEGCRADEDCCNGLCDRPGGVADGTCARLDDCLSAGEPCAMAGLNGSCCSFLCLDTDGTGPRCQPLSGCRASDELCASDAECCSGVCEQTATTEDGRPIRRCVINGSCFPPGALCEPFTTGDCCPNGGGDSGCNLTRDGTRRCFGDDDACTAAGQACVADEECCTFAFPALRCQPGPSGGSVCCLSADEPCALGDACCSGVCAPGADGATRCASACVPDGGVCRSDAECCGCGCDRRGASDGVCTSDPSRCGGCTGPSLGQPCDPGGEPCCDGPEVECVSTGEVPTCRLVP